MFCQIDAVLGRGDYPLILTPGAPVIGEGLVSQHRGDHLIGLLPVPDTLGTFAAELLGNF